MSEKNVSPCYVIHVALREHYGRKWKARITDRERLLFEAIAHLAAADAAFFGSSAAVRASLRCLIGELVPEIQIDAARILAHYMRGDLEQVWDNVRPKAARRYRFSEEGLMLLLDRPMTEQRGI